MLSLRKCFISKLDCHRGFARAGHIVSQFSLSFFLIAFRDKSGLPLPSLMLKLSQKYVRPMLSERGTVESNKHTLGLILLVGIKKLRDTNMLADYFKVAPSTDEASQILNIEKSR